MLEELCRGALWDACKVCEEKAPLVTLKGKPWKKESKFADFFDSGVLIFNWNCIPIEKIVRQRPQSNAKKAWVWFNANADAICKGFIDKRHGGNLEKAMLSFGSFDALFTDFKTYFAERKNVIMEKTEMALQAKKTELASKGKTPQSHGGVANLLKVLTKTMQGQGSNIQTIAKVQYAVCMQAGIFIPDEFLTDVMIATDIMGADNGL